MLGACLLDSLSYQLQSVKTASICWDMTSVCMYKQDRGGGTKREETRRGRQVCVCTSRIEGE